MRVSGVTLHVSEALRHLDVLWCALERSLQERLAWVDVDETTAGSKAPPIEGGHLLPWAYLECEFHYAPHRQICAEGGVTAAGTRFPLVLLFVESATAAMVAKLAGDLQDWLSTPGGLFAQSRTLLLAYGGKPASLRRDAAPTLLKALVQHDFGVVELKDAIHASEYVVQCATAVAESRKRRVPSRFKVAGVRCQTLGSDPADKLRIAWVSQLMQIPGVSEEIAKVVAERYPTPAAVMRAAADADPAGACAQGSCEGHPGSVADGFFADLEYPIRGKKGTRRIGPIVSRRIFTLFHPATPAEHLLI
mmetsp:Transcript_127035/g.206745  ORF Transcript_127035/g.206745 Transcript_127035/m.206745 type:complete len:306 (-) Transcript_127035:45-962(-)